MTDLWMGYAAKDQRRDLARALQSVEPFARISFASNARELREAFRDEESGKVGAIVGLLDEGVSDVNLAAALAQDGRASEVLLVSREVSGSLKSRAHCAGIDGVIGLEEAAQASVDTSDEAVWGTEDAADKSRSSDSSKRDEPVAVEPPATPKATEPKADGRTSEPTKANAPVPSAAPAGEGKAPVLVFASGRGGVGKTTMAALCAATAALWGMSVAVVDLDLSCGNLHTLYGVRHGAELDRLSGVEPTAEALGRANVRLADNVLLWGPCERPEMAEQVAPLVKPLLSYLQERYDLVVVDTSTTFTDAGAQAAQLADRLVLVHEPGTDSIYSLGKASALAVRLGVARTRIVRLENRADLRAEVAPSFARAEVGLEGARAFRVPEADEDDKGLIEAGNMGALAEAGGEFDDAVAALLAQLLSEVGALPEADSAQRALHLKVGRKRFSLFGKRKEA